MYNHTSSNTWSIVKTGGSDAVIAILSDMLNHDGHTDVFSGSKYPFFGRFGGDFNATDRDGLWFAHIAETGKSYTWRKDSKCNRK